MDPRTNFNFSKIQPNQEKILGMQQKVQNKNKNRQ